MDIRIALKQVLDAAEQPRKTIAGSEAVMGEDLQERLEKGKIRPGDRRRQNLNDAQDAVSRLIWHTCAKEFKDLDGFIDGFCYDLNPNHEVALWLVFAICFNRFMRLHPSENRQNVIGSLSRLSCQLPPTGLSPKRSRELAKIWSESKGGLDGDELEKLIDEMEFE
jgi:hypothetical protein